MSPKASRTGFVSATIPTPEFLRVRFGPVSEHSGEPKFSHLPVRKESVRTTQNANGPLMYMFRNWEISFGLNF